MIGYISVHRQITDWEWYTDSKMVHLFLHIVLLANHTDRKWQGRTIKRGQFITSLKGLSNSTGISVQSVRTLLAKLQKSGEIKVESTQYFTVLTVNKYGDYQNSNNDNQHTINTPSTHHQHTTNKPSTTTNNVNNYNNVNNDDKKKGVPCDLENLIIRFNQQCDKLAQVQKLTNQRKAALKNRIEEHGIEQIEVVFETVSGSDFLNGKNDKGWRADFDWILKPTNFVKILEGNYKNKPQSGSTPTFSNR